LDQLGSRSLIAIGGDAAPQLPLRPPVTDLVRNCGHLFASPSRMRQTRRDLSQGARPLAKEKRAERGTYVVPAKTYPTARIGNPHSVEPCSGVQAGARPARTKNR